MSSSSCEPSDSDSPGNSSNLQLSQGSPSTSSECQPSKSEESDETKLTQTPSSEDWKTKFHDEWTEQDRLAFKRALAEAKPSAVPQPRMSSTASSSTKYGNGRRGNSRKSTRPKRFPPTSSPKSPNSDLVGRFPTVTADFIDEHMYMQVHNLYKRGLISFDPDHVKSAYSPMINVSQGKFILKNVVCEWENRVQKWFDQILKVKLKEQHEVFLKFSCDQVKRGEHSAPNPSYLM